MNKSSNRSILGWRKSRIDMRETEKEGNVAARVRLWEKWVKQRDKKSQKEAKEIWWPGITKKVWFLCIFVQSICLTGRSSTSRPWQLLWIFMSSLTWTWSRPSGQLPPIYTPVSLWLPFNFKYLTIRSVTRVKTEHHFIPIKVTKVSDISSFRFYYFKLIASAILILNFNSMLISLSMIHPVNIVNFTIIQNIQNWFHSYSWLLHIFEPFTDLVLWHHVALQKTGLAI